MLKSRLGKNQLVVVAVLELATSACSNHPKGSQPVLERLGSQVSANSADHVAYVAAFPDAVQAQTHAQAIRTQGGNVRMLSQDGRVQAVSADRDQLLQAVAPADALITADTLIRPTTAIAAQPTDSSNATDPQALTDLLTVRRVVGVEALLARFPEADGRGLKVAVFDTGIDFGVEGLNLVGFYDFTGFGKVQIQPNTTLPTEFRFATDVAALEIRGTGILDEAALAKAHLLPEGINLNGNKTEKGEAVLNDRFTFVLGVNAAGLPAIWVDANSNGVLSHDEELTDYNTTHRHIDLLTNIATPSGAFALAVTIPAGDASEVQFHSVRGGHGTSCGIIIAGDGYANGSLRGMAPKAQLLAYLLDVSGQDVYTMSQFVQMFVHAKEQGVNAISISYGFATADLESARFLADFLDKEIASAGILIGIAAGNDGPGFSSEVADDYIPHHGIAVGASISSEQARNVYGWIGDVQDTMIYYSGFGPSRGGRQIPDLSSPLMTWVRGERSTEAVPFRGFGGTSSATPAMIGATTALQSALKQNGEVQIDVRLLKLALQNTAEPFDGIESVRQGAGLLDVSRAYDVYKRLAAELRAAKADGRHRTSFAYDLRAVTPLENRPQMGEGVHFHEFQPNAQIQVNLTPASLELVDPLVFFEAVTIEHSADFFETRDVLGLQAGGAKFSLQFKASAMAQPGIYSDTILLKRLADGLVLLRIPVVIEIPTRANQQGVLGEISRDVAPFDVVRLPIHLDEASPIVLDALLRQQGANGGPFNLFVTVQNSAGHKVFDTRTPVERAFQSLSLRTPILPTGDYQVLIYPGFGQPSTLVTTRIEGSVHLPVAKVIAIEAAEKQIRAVIQSSSAGNITVAAASIKLTHVLLDTMLIRNGGSAARAGFEGELDLGRATGQIEIGLLQSRLDRALYDGLAMELTVLDAVTDVPLYRGWINFREEAEALTPIVLTAQARKVKIVAYPNIVNWERFQSGRIRLDAAIPLAELSALPSATLSFSNPLVVQSLRTTVLTWESESFLTLPESTRGVIELKNASGALIELLPTTLDRR